MSVGGVLLTSASLVGVGAWQAGAFGSVAEHEAGRIVDADLDHITTGAYNLVQSQDDAVQQKVDGDLNVARGLLARAGAVSFGRPVTWTATDQVSKDAAKVSLRGCSSAGRGWGKTVTPAPPPLSSTTSRPSSEAQPPSSSV